MGHAVFVQGGIIMNNITTQNTLNVNYSSQEAYIKKMRMVKLTQRKKHYP